MTSVRMILAYVRIKCRTVEMTMTTLRTSQYSVETNQGGWENVN